MLREARFRLRLVAAPCSTVPASPTKRRDRPPPSRRRAPVRNPRPQRAPPLERRFLQPSLGAERRFAAVPRQRPRREYRAARFEGERAHPGGWAAQDRPVLPPPLETPGRALAATRSSEPGAPRPSPLQTGRVRTPGRPRNARLARPFRSTAARLRGERTEPARAATRPERRPPQVPGQPPPDPEDESAGKPGHGRRLATHRGRRICLRERCAFRQPPRFSRGPRVRLSCRTGL